MFRIDDPSATTSLPAPEAAGTEGYWTEGNPGSGVPATLERASWFNMIQEELRAVVVAGGLTPSKTTYNQLLSAINALRTAAFTGTNQSKAGAGYQKLPGGLILQWGTASASVGGTSNGFNIPFPTACVTVVPIISAVSASSYLSAAIIGPNQFNLYSNTGTPAVLWIAIGY
jgi:hypothetical protein